MNAAAQGSALGDAAAPAGTEVLGRRYHVLEIVGRGGMGTVYLARDRLAGVVALKRLHRSVDEIAHDASRTFGAKTAAPTVALGLADEFKVLTSLHHPHVISVIDYGFDDQKRPYYTMDLLKGAQTITEAGKHQPHEARVGLLAQVLQALVYMHRWGVIHRDLKPGNVLVVDGQVKVLDFGLAIAREGLEGQATVSGSPGFVAPELFEGQPASAASDLYSLGMIAYRLFAMPVAPGRPMGLPAHFEESPLGQVLRRLSAPEPHERYRTAEEALAALTEATGHQVVIETSATRESFLQGARFVGREREVGRLEKVLQLALGGRGSAWLVGGESGVGKSRLLEEIRTLALVRGAVVVRGQAVSEGGIPYQEWRAVLRWLVLLAEPTDFEASVLKPLVEDIEALLGRPVPGLVEIDPEMAQARLFTVVEDLFRRVPQPTLLILEDQHWAASDSLRLLARLSALARTTPLLILATYRDDERPELPGELPRMEVLKLPRLDTEAISVLCESMIGETGRSPRLVELLRRETEGNPFFLVEVVRSLAEETGQLDRIGSAPLPDKVFPGGVRQIVQRRLAKLPPSARELLQLAAVIGRQIDPKLLRVCAPTMRMDAWLNECASAAVLDVSDGQWRFAHDKLREGVLADLTPRAEPLLHRQAAVAIEALYPDSPDWTVALAAHWGKAGDKAKEIHYTQKAGEQALAVYACREAIPHLERALALSLPPEGTPALKPEHRAQVGRLEAQLAEAAFQLGHPDRFRVHAERALRHFGWKMPNSPARWALGVLWQIFYRISQAAVPEAFEVTSPEKQQRRLEAGRLLVRLAEISVYAQDIPRLLWSGLRMLNLDAPVGPSSDLSRGYALMAIVMGSMPPTRPISERWLARALAMAEQVGSPVEKAYALSQYAMCGIAVARWERVETWGDQAVALAQSVGYSRQAEETLAVLAATNTIRGRYQQALERLDQVEASARRRGALQTKRWGPIMRVGPLMRLGRSAEAVALLEPELPGIDADAESSEKIVAYGPLALAQLRLGDTAKARSTAARTLEVLRSIKPVTFFLYPGILAMVETYFMLWEQPSALPPAERASLEKEARAASRVLRTFALINPFARPYARLARGSEAWLSGRTAAAREAWHSALAQAERLAMPFEQARARFELGRHLEAQEPARQEHLQRARALFSQLGAVDEVARVQAELDRP